MSGWGEHLTIAPIILPLLIGALMVLVRERWRWFQAGLGIVSMIVLVVMSVMLVLQADATEPVGGATTVSVYRLGDWPALFGIVLVVDRLSALMLVLASVLGLGALTFSLIRWHTAGTYFHPLFQFQLMGINGAVLTGDLFNLFVFFEVMLAASYGLVLHGSGAARVRAGLHYIAVNLAASLLFLIGVSVIYGVTGTLNMADLAGRVSGLAPTDRGLFEAGAAILGVALLIKAGMWPLGFWLPTSYAVASAPAAAILSILSKVGVYTVLRLWLLLFGEGAGESEGFGGSWLLVGGLLTIIFGSIAVLATQSIVQLAGASLLVSSGTLLAAIGAGQASVTSGALFYLVSSVFGVAAFFLLTELVERDRGVGADLLAVTRDAFGEEEEPAEEVIGVAIPAATAILGLSFLACALLMSGLPPLSSFLAKFAILAPLFGLGQEDVSPVSWMLLAGLTMSSLATIIAMTRAGVDVFWASPAAVLPRVGLVEIAPVLMFLALSVTLTVQAGPVMRYMEATATSLHAARGYVRGVLPASSQTPASPTEGPHR